MAVLRQENWLGQQRVDVPMLRAVESAVAADFDTVVGRIVTGSQPVVIRGFQLANFGAGTQVTAVQLAVANSILANINASQSGSFLWVPANRGVEVLDPALNPRVKGSWTAGQINFVGLDLTRDADPSTSDLVEFKNPNTNLEVAKEVPLARVLDYKIVITTTPFSAQPNLVPIAKVDVSGLSQVNSVTDARNMMFRLATGGDTPSNVNIYGWPDGRGQTTLTNSFNGGDRAISSMRDLVQALESRIWEIGGGEDWYSLTADRNVFMTNTGTTAPLADYFTWDGTNLLWIGLRFTFENANTGGTFYNIVNDQTSALPGTTNLLDGECIYVDLDRTNNATLTVPPKVPIQQLGQGTIPGARQVIAVRRGADVFTRGSRNPVGVPVPPATTTTLGIVKLGQTSETPLSPVVPNFASGHTIAWTATSGIALMLTAANNTVGLEVIGTGASGPGIIGTSNGASIGTGVAGVVGYGASTAPGVYGEGRSANARGLWGQGIGSGEGVFGVGGTTNGTGVSGNAGTGGNGFGVFGAAATSGGAGVYGSGASGGPGGKFDSTATNVDVIQSLGYIDMHGGTQPTATTAFSNRITKKNVCKFWWYGFATGSGGISTGDAFNLGTVSFVPGTRADFTFGSAMSGNYTIVAQVESASGIAYIPIIPNALKSGSGFSIEIMEIGSPGGGYVGTLLNLGFSTDYALSIHVFGPQ